MAIPEYKTTALDIREVFYELSRSPKGIYDDRKVIDWKELSDSLGIFGDIFLNVINENRSRVRVMGKEKRGVEMPEKMEAYLLGRGVEIKPALKVAKLRADDISAIESEANKRGNTVIPIAVDQADGCCEIIERVLPTSFSE